MFAVAIPKKKKGKVNCPSCHEKTAIDFHEEETCNGSEIVEAHIHCSCGYSYKFAYGYVKVNGNTFYNQSILPLTITEVEEG